jgi:hypothetical protein
MASKLARKVTARCDISGSFNISSAFLTGDVTFVEEILHYSDGVCSDSSASGLGLGMTLGNELGR